MIVKLVGAKWCVFADGDELRGEFDSKAEALQASQDMQACRTSEALDERPFLVDGVELEEFQVRRIGNLVGNASLRRAPMTLAQAIESWRRQNLVVMESGKKRWRVHSGSPTYKGSTFLRASVEEDADPEDGSEELFTLAESIEKQGRVWRIVIIEEGWSKNGRYYPREVLEASIPLWEGAGVFCYGYNPAEKNRQKTDHISEPGVHVKNKAGWIESVGGRERNGRYQLVGEFHLLDNDIREGQLYAWSRGKRDFLSFSIHARGDSVPGVAEGRRGRIAVALRQAEELTLVGKPAAGGCFEALVASVTEEETNMFGLRKFLKARLPKAVGESVDTMEGKPLCESFIESYRKEFKESDDAIIQLALDFLAEGKTEEAVKCLEKLAASKAPAEGGSDPAGVSAGPADLATYNMESVQKKAEGELNAAVKAANDEVHKLRVERCAAQLDKALTESKLPEKTAELVREAFQNRVFEQSELTESIRKHRDALAAVAPAPGVEQEQSRSRTEVVVDAVDKLQARSDLMMGFDPSKATLSEAQKDLYKACAGARRENRPHAIYEDCLESGELRESATTTNFPGLMGTSMNRVLEQKWELRGEAQWEPFVYVNNDIQNLKQQTRVIMGGFSQVPIVAEAGSYTEAAVPGELTVTYDLAKYGEIYSVTEEMILNDDLDGFRQIPDDMQEAAGYTQDFAVFTALAASGMNSYDGTAIYHANHNNLQTGAAIAYSTMVEMRTRMRNQRRFAHKTELTGNYTAASGTCKITSTDGVRVGSYGRFGRTWFKVTAITDADDLAIEVQSFSNSVDENVSSGASVYFYGRAIAMQGFIVIAATDKEAEVMEILTSEKVPHLSNNTRNQLAMDYQTGKIAPIFVDAPLLGGSTTTWYGQAMLPDRQRGIEIGFHQGQRVPRVINQNAQDVGDVWEKDKFGYKLKMRFGVKHKHHEGSQKATA